MYQIIIILIILSFAACIYLFIRKDNEINELNIELEKIKKEKDNKINELKCDCPAIPKCPDPPQCPTTICPDCPSTNDIIYSLFPGRSMLPSDFYDNGQQGNKEMEILDTDYDKNKKKLINQSLDIQKNYKYVINNIKKVLGDTILADQKESE